MADGSGGGGNGVDGGADRVEQTVRGLLAVRNEVAAVRTELAATRAQNVHLMRELEIERQERPAYVMHTFNAGINQFWPFVQAHLAQEQVRQDGQVDVLGQMLDQTQQLTVLVGQEVLHQAEHRIEVNRRLDAVEIAQQRLRQEAEDGAQAGEAEHLRLHRRIDGLHEGLDDLEAYIDSDIIVHLPTRPWDQGLTQVVTDHGAMLHQIRVVFGLEGAELGNGGNGNPMIGEELALGREETAETEGGEVNDVVGEADDVVSAPEDVEDSGQTATAPSVHPTATSLATPQTTTAPSTQRLFNSGGGAAPGTPSSDKEGNDTLFTNPSPLKRRRSGDGEYGEGPVCKALRTDGDAIATASPSVDSSSTCRPLGTLDESPQALQGPISCAVDDHMQEQVSPIRLSKRARREHLRARKSLLRKQFADGKSKGAASLHTSSPLGTSGRGSAPQSPASSLSSVPSPQYTPWSPQYGPLSLQSSEIGSATVPTQSPPRTPTSPSYSPTTPESSPEAVCIPSSERGGEGKGASEGEREEGPSSEEGGEGKGAIEGEREEKDEDGVAVSSPCGVAGEGDEGVPEGVGEGEDGEVWGVSVSPHYRPIQPVQIGTPGDPIFLTDSPPSSW